jgi:hypothetical protein
MWKHITTERPADGGFQWVRLLPALETPPFRTTYHESSSTFEMVDRFGDSTALSLVPWWIVSEWKSFVPEEAP